MATDPLRAGPEPRGGYANVHPPAGGKPRQAPPPPPEGVRGQQMMTLFRGFIRGNEGGDAGVSMATEKEEGRTSDLICHDVSVHPSVYEASASSSD